MILVLVAQAAVAEGAQGIGALGLNVQALIFQVVNFAILLLLLQRFAYRPLLKTLQNRRQQIEESLASAKQIAAERESLVREREQALTQARQEAVALVAAGKDQAQALVAAAEAAAQVRAQRVRDEGQQRLEQDVQEARTQLKTEVVALVALATEQLLREKLDADTDMARIEKIVHDMESRAKTEGAR